MRILDTCIQKTREKPARLVYRLFQPAAGVIDRFLAFYVYAFIVGRTLYLYVEKIREMSWNSVM